MNKIIRNIEKVAGLFKGSTRNIFCVIFSIVVLSILFDKVDLNKISMLIKQVDKRYLTFSMIMAAIMPLFAASAKWQYLLRLFGIRMRYFESIFVVMSIEPLKLIFPFKSSEFFRGSYFYLNYKLSVAKCGAYIFINYFLMLAVLLMTILMGRMILYSNVMIVVLGSLTLSLFVFKGVLYAALKVYGKIVNKSQIKFSKESNQEIILMAIFSFLTVFCNIGSFYFLVLAFGFDIKFIHLMEVVPLVNIITNIPIAFYGIGSREMAILFFLKSYGTMEELIACSFMYFLICDIFPAFLGLPFLYPFMKQMKLEKGEGQTSRWKIIYVSFFHNKMRYL